MTHAITTHIRREPWLYGGLAGGVALFAAAAVTVGIVATDHDDNVRVRRTPFNVACQMLRDGTDRRDIPPALVDMFWPGEPGYGERPDVDAQTAVDLAVAANC